MFHKIVAIYARRGGISSNHTHPFNGPFSGTTRVSWYQKGKTNLDFNEQETVSGSGISWAICKSAPHSRQITTPAPHRSVFLQAGCPSYHPTSSVKALHFTANLRRNLPVKIKLWKSVCRSVNGDKPRRFNQHCYSFDDLLSRCNLVGAGVNWILNMMKFLSIVLIIRCTTNRDVCRCGYCKRAFF